MKVKYLGTLFAASVLSLGLVTSCATTPDAGDVDAGDGTTEVDPVNPCAGVENPCAGVENPCAGSEDPCAGS